MLVVVFMFDKFKEHLIGTIVMVYTNHTALRYLFANKVAMHRLMCLIQLLQELDLTIKDQNGTENQMEDHLSRLTNPDVIDAIGEILEKIPNEELWRVEELTPWFGDIVNYLVIVNHYLLLLMHKRTPWFAADDYAAVRRSVRTLEVCLAHVATCVRSVRTMLG